MRRIISAVLALCLTALGATGLIWLLLYSQGAKGFMYMGAAALFVAGAIWLYSDWIERPDQGNQNG
jgi:hypothetical protein